MARKQSNPKKLLVEGDEDKRVIPELIEANGIPWGEKKETAIVYIKSYGSVTELLDPDVIYTELIADSEVTELGIIVDADDNPPGRWDRIRQVCLPTIPNFPESLPETGLIHPLENGKKFGVWMMPDNKIKGMLETFLAYLVPNQDDPVWTYTETVIQEAKNKGATFIERHIDNAKIHTWLAWQDPPGRQLHNAVMERILNPNHPNSAIFLDWFKMLYDV